jgi:alkanesulfonate monooxygenase
MKFKYDDEAIEVFTISPRTTIVDEYWKNIEQVIAWSDQYDATGILLFEGNDTFVQPWLAGHATFTNTTTLCPLVAVNPVYMHPFTAAKMVSSFAYLYGRKTYLNMITGTALSYLDALNDHLDKEQRYDRLREYSELISLLTASGGQPVTYEGEYYKTKNLKLEPAVPENLQPTFYIAGQSEGAVKTSQAIGAVHMQMLPARLDAELRPGATGIHFGIVTRNDEDAAWRAAKENFPPDAEGRRMQAFSMNNTDSVWKQRMMMATKMEEDAQPGYWLEPFRNFKADCPYFIGSRSQVAGLVSRLVRNGIRHIILDIPRAEQEFAEIDAAFAEAAQLLACDSLPTAKAPIRK